jgi:hypothetical protein
MLAAFQLVAAGVGAVVGWATVVVETGLAVAGPLAEAGRTLGAALAAPWSVGVLLMHVFVAAAAFVALRRVLSVREV